MYRYYRGYFAVAFIYYALVSCFGNCQDFSYEGDHGPEHWGKQYNECAGKYQSPINIELIRSRKISFPPIILQGFNEEPENAELKNNGHTVVVTLDFKNHPAISGGPLIGTYEFAQFHFHWGDNDTYGSEDLINNHSFPIELHMVFYKENYEDFSNALRFPDGVVVLAFFYETSDKINPFYEEFTLLLDQIIHPKQYTHFFEPPPLKDLITNNYMRYYAYRGSLTTPPCSEVVTWIDFATPIPISSHQIKRFRHLTTHDGRPLTHNFRPTQPLNGRIIYQNVPIEEIDFLEHTIEEENANYNDIRKVFKQNQEDSGINISPQRAQSSSIQNLGQKITKLISVCIIVIKILNNL